MKSMKEQSLSNKMEVDMLLSMIRIRHFEETVKKLGGEGLTRGPVHLYIGEEAVAVGMCAALEADDYLTSTHRGHGHNVAKGADLNRMMAELLGREEGYCKGRGGSICVGDRRLQRPCGSAIWRRSRLLP